MYHSNSNISLIQFIVTTKLSKYHKKPFQLLQSDIITNTAPVSQLLHYFRQYHLGLRVLAVSGVVSISQIQRYTKRKSLVCTSFCCSGSGRKEKRLSLPNADKYYGWIMEGQPSTKERMAACSLSVIFTVA